LHGALEGGVEGIGDGVAGVELLPPNNTPAAFKWWSGLV